MRPDLLFWFPDLLCPSWTCFWKGRESTWKWRRKGESKTQITNHKFKFQIFVMKNLMLKNISSQQKTSDSVQTFSSTENSLPLQKTNGLGWAKTNIITIIITITIIAIIIITIITIIISSSSSYHHHHHYVDHAILIVVNSIITWRHRWRSVKSSSAIHSFATGAILLRCQKP